MFAYLIAYLLICLFACFMVFPFTLIASALIGFECFFQCEHRIFNSILQNHTDRMHVASQQIMCFSYNFSNINARLACLFGLSPRFVQYEADKLVLV